MLHIIRERTADSLSENRHNIGETFDTIYGDAFLRETDPVVCLVCISWMRMRSLNCSGLILRDHLQLKLVTCGNVQPTHESIFGIVGGVKLCPNISMTNGGKEMLLHPLFILAVGCCMQLSENGAPPSCDRDRPRYPSAEHVNLSKTHFGLFRWLRKREYLDPEAVRRHMKI